MLRSKDFKQAVESMPRRRPVTGLRHPLPTASSWGRAFFDFLRPRRYGCFRFRSASGNLRAASGNSACDWRGWAEGRGSGGAGRWRRGASQQPPFSRAAARSSAKTRDLARPASAAPLVEGAAGRTGSVRVGGSGSVGVLGGGAEGPGVRARQPLLGHGRSPSLARWGTPSGISVT